MGYINDPVTEVTLALSRAEVPEEIINWPYLEEVRRFMDSPIDGSVKYSGFAIDGNRLSVVAAKCHCGWYNFYSSLESAPDKCPRCGAELPIVTT